MYTNSTPETDHGERDPRLLMWSFVTLAVASIYFITLINTHPIRQPLPFILFTGLTILHILLHWQLGRIIHQPRKIIWYLLIQGVLAFLILLMADNQLMTTALFMILIGESIGVLGLNRWSLLAAAYFGLLLTANLVILSGWDSVGSFLLGALPITAVVILSVTLYMRQITARQQAQSLSAEMETTNRQLAEYAAQVEELTLIAERQRIARELHDTLSQGLTGLVLQLEAIKAHLEAGRDERALAIITQSLARARGTLSDSRAAIDDLRAIPASLPEAMRAKVERFTQATGIPCELSLSLGDTVPPKNTEDHLLRILNEALANITRHAQANQVWVRLEEENNHLELEIRDDGQGFDPASATGGGHYGLLGMRERARLVGGTLTVDSRSGGGTCISFIVPVNQEI
ncbi:MAG: sensor histidine kinase [Anaerolineales bacterium]|jgi:NarL family two-component system sensor histidine kinase YdfH